MSVLTFVTIGDEGNAVDTTGYGDVSYAYDISKFEITEGNIADYNADPANSARLITIDSRGTDKPATDITWNECARYVNWLNINDGAQPAYNFALPGINEYIDLWTSGEAWQLDGENLFRHKDAKYFIPNENEWYKAAFYKSGSTSAGYWLYATGSDTAPAGTSGSTVPGEAVYAAALPQPTVPADVTNAGGLSPYGTMGQSGNVYEITENTFDGANVNVFANRVRRGGSFGDLSSSLRNTSRAFAGAQTGSPSAGLRVAKVSAPAPPVELTFVTIGDVGNAADTTSYGDVSYTYQIGKYEVTEGQISAYNADPINSTRQITTDNRGTNKPATSITWNECARYANWLNIKEGLQPAYYFTTSGVTDDITLWSSGEAWQLDGENLYRHKDAKYFLPSEDEWYKAAYYKSGGTSAGYWLYPTGSDTASTAVASGTAAGTAVINGQTGPADVTQAGGLNPYGAMGQGGNAFEWNETAFDGNNDSVGESRTARGGSWFLFSDVLKSSFRGFANPADESFDIGFRVASVVPPAPPSGNTSPVLNLADNLKMGSTQVTAAYLDSVRVWPTYDGVWTFDDPAPGTTITGFQVDGPQDSTVVWGDGTSDILSAPTDTINHTY